MSEARKLVQNSKKRSQQSSNGAGISEHHDTSERLEVRKTYKLYIGGKFPRSESGRYITFANARGETIANTCRASRKDFREAVVAARAAFKGWSARSAYNRGQILYRISEMLEGRRAQFEQELKDSSLSPAPAKQEVQSSVDRFLYFAGWTDKYQQVFGSVNPVSSAHFNFSIPEPMGVIVLIAPEEPTLLGLTSLIAPAIAGGNTVIAVASSANPLSAITLAEVLHSSDVPAGVVNILTGLKDELMPHVASHMDVNGVVYGDSDSDQLKLLKKEAAKNVKRVISKSDTRWESDQSESPYSIMDTQEIKTAWHPIGR